MSPEVPAMCFANIPSEPEQGWSYKQYNWLYLKMFFLSSSQKFIEDLPTCATIIVTLETAIYNKQINIPGGRNR